MAEVIQPQPIEEEAQYFAVETPDRETIRILIKELTQLFTQEAEATRMLADNLVRTS